jgi:hypothetical protein
MRKCFIGRDVQLDTRMYKSLQVAPGNIGRVSGSPMADCTVRWIGGLSIGKVRGLAIEAADD